MIIVLTTIYNILENLNDFDGKEVKIAGRVRTNEIKKIWFINLNDGSAFSGVQLFTTMSWRIFL